MTCGQGRRVDSSGPWKGRAPAEGAVVPVDRGRRGAVGGHGYRESARRRALHCGRRPVPGCGVWSNRVHGSSLRFPADVPSAGQRVVLRLRVRRFACGNSHCARRTFVEQISDLARRHGQRNERLRSALVAAGLALAGRAGARPGLCPRGVRQPQHCPAPGRSSSRA
ncbi:transposase family protein [Streptomyces sp. NPDC005828]|uniref:transposase family protein n=1 Tax=Streptomyces sp. NPDC005828 TaxID=3157071 RepID=UPI0033F16694